MKERISATVDEDVIKIIEKFIEDHNYRNKSHVIETAIRLMKENKDAKKK